MKYWVYTDFGWKEISGNSILGALLYAKINGYKLIAKAKAK